jgi:hypothetical protein
MGMKRRGTSHKFEGCTGELNTGQGAKTAWDSQLLVGQSKVEMAVWGLRCACYPGRR